jgi:TPR repeat protein
MYEVGEGLEQSYPEAISYYNKGCGLEMDKACEDVLKLYAKMAHMYESGEGFAQSYSEAASYYDKACEGGIYESCQSLSNLYVKGLGVKQNLPKAQSLIERSCTATDNGGECYQFAVAFLDVGDRAKAEQFFTLGCDKNHMNSCRELVNIYARGRQKDYFKASTYLEKVCNSGDENSCYELALIYADKKSGMSDMEEAKRYFGKACTFGSKDGCSAEKKIVIEPKKDAPQEHKKR